MKNYLRILLLSSALPGFALFGVCTKASAATLSVSPAVTSNTYAGVITLSITGLTNGEQVEIQKYLDLNSNGIVDLGEPLTDAFRISDGGVALIGGITNLNIPFDSNPAAGAVTTTLNFLPALVTDTFAASSIYRLVSPTGRFTPVTTTFVVTNAAFTQFLSGTVYSNGLSPFPNAVVVAQDQQANNPAAGSVTDSAGHYSLALRPGSYSLIALAQNYYFDQSFAPSINLTNGMSATNDLFLTNGTVSISGSVYDAATSNKLGGVLMQLQSGNLFAITFSDANGDYSAAVTPAFWKIQPTKERLARRGYVVPQAKLQVDTTTGSVANVGLALPAGNALFYGRLNDNSNTPLPNVEIDSGTDDNSYGAKGYSDANGNYAVAVLGDGTNRWSCGVNNGRDPVLGSYIFNSFENTNVTPNLTVLQNFVALPATARISGSVHDNSGNPVTGVTLISSATIGSNRYQSLDSSTDNSGNYSLEVASGFWQVEFLNGGSSDNLDSHGFADLSGPHFVSIPPTNAVLNLTVYPIGTPAISGPHRFSATQFGFTVTGATNVNYTVETSTNLTSANWTTLFSFLMTTNPFTIMDPYATNKTRFYRVKKD